VRGVGEPGWNPTNKRTQGKRSALKFFLGIQKAEFLGENWMMYSHADFRTGRRVRKEQV
jgi:hypothetical protein